MIIGVPKEKAAGETRVALVPDLVSKLIALGLTVEIESDAGQAAGFPDREYEKNGAKLTPEVSSQADVLFSVRPPTVEEIAKLKERSVCIAFLEPFSSPERIALFAEGKITAFAMELMPRIARAQSMDALSAMSMVAGYKAVLLAANRLAKFFPLLMTAAGTVHPARVFVIGAGVAGLEAIGTAKRLGALVTAYDTRPSVKDEVESVGATFVELNLDTKDAEEKGGYASPQTEEFYRRQQALMLEHVAAADVVITAALVQGRQPPLLITEEMIRAMRAGSIIVDLAAAQGGNCVLTEPEREVIREGIIILGPTNLPSTMPYHSSQLYARTVFNFFMHLFRDGRIALDPNDELTRATLLTKDGAVLHPAMQP
jgi:NAD(P) transhydrogenase subunit alpha